MPAWSKRLDSWVTGEPVYIAPMAPEAQALQDPADTASESPLLRNAVSILRLPPGEINQGADNSKSEIKQARALAHFASLAMGGTIVRPVFASKAELIRWVLPAFQTATSGVTW